MKKKKKKTPARESAKKTVRKTASSTRTRTAARRPKKDTGAARRRAIGRIGWADLTVPNADEVRDFYTAVLGWTVEPVDMGGYSDYSLKPSSGGEPVAGVCHARGVNAGLPPHWLIYVSVDDLDRSMAECRKRGGAVKAGPKSMGAMGRYCLIQDPAGAFMALVEPPGGKR